MPQAIRTHSRGRKLKGSPGQRRRRRVARAGSATATREDNGAIRERILQAAEHVFAERGYAGATTQEIARGAGIQKRMLFYYFPGKEQLYAETLDRFLAGVRTIHSRFHEAPGPVGLQQIIAGLIHFVVMNPDPVRILIREIMDDGPHLPRIVERDIGPLFAAGLAETRRNMEHGIFHEEDPMHALVNVGGSTLFYFIIAPLLRRLWDRDPMAPAAIEERIAATARFVLDGMQRETAPGPGRSSAAAARGGAGGRPAPATSTEPTGIVEQGG